MGICTLSCRHPPPAFPVLFSLLRASFGGFTPLAGPLSLPSLPKSWAKGVHTGGLAARSCCVSGLFPVMPSAALGPRGALLPCLQPARGSLFSLLGAEAKLVFLPRSGIAPQKHTMQLLKYLGLAGRPHSGPLVRLADGGLLMGAKLGACLCWRCAGWGRGGAGVRERPRSSGASAALHGGGLRHGGRGRTIGLCSQAGWHITQRCQPESLHVRPQRHRHLGV